MHAEIEHPFDENPFDYGELDAETRAFVQGTADEIHGLLKRTVENVVKIGQLLNGVKERLPYGQFLLWIKAEFGLSRWTAQNFMRVAERFGETWGKFHHLPISVLYELAAPSTSEAVIEQVESEQVPPTLEAIRNAKEGERQARDEQAALQEQLALEREAAAAQIGQLSLELERVQGELTQLSAPPEPQIREVPVVPPDVPLQLETLRRQVATLTAQREVALRQAATLGEQVQALAAKRDVEQYAREIRLAWSNATAALHTGLLKFLAQLPTPQQTQIFEAADWNRLTQAQALLKRVLGECERFRQESQGMVVEAMPGTSSTNDKVGREDRTTST